MVGITANNSLVPFAPDHPVYRTMRLGFCFLHSIFPTVVLLLSGTSAKAADDGVEFFENKVRPLFAQHCYSCHSEKAEKLKGGLRLDSPEGVLKGGTSGQIIVPGEPDSSLLIKAVRYTDPDLQMPPKNKKLSAEQIAVLEAWVKMRAPLPRSSTASSSLTDITVARARHWAFQPVQKPKPPPVKLSSRV